MNKSASILTNTNFTLADRIKIQQDCIRRKDYIVLGRLSAVLFEGQRNIKGFSQSRARYQSTDQQKAIAANSPAMAPFSEKQTQLWASITLDWLGLKNAPVIAISRDRRDLLLPYGMTPLPKIPHPGWVPKHSQSVCPKSVQFGCSSCVPPRIPQLLTGCPVVGDRVRDKITGRDGRVYGVLHPISALSTLLSGQGGTFMPIRCGSDPADGTHLAMMIDDSNPEAPNGYFVGGRFQIGG